jgi:hypothetical protein
MALPIRLLWSLQITFVEKTGVGIAFIFGFITIICAIIRAVSLNTAASQDQSIPISWLILWASIEGLAGASITSPSKVIAVLITSPAIIVNCLPTFAIFFRARVMSSRAYGSKSNRYAQQGSTSIPSNRKAPSIPLEEVKVEGEDPTLQQYRERANAGQHRVGVSTNGMGKKDLTGGDWSANRRREDADNSSQESIIGMSPDHVDFTLGDKDGVFVTRTVVVR